MRQRRQLNFPIQGSSLLGPVVRVSTRSQLRGHVAFRFGQDNAERAAVPVHAHLHRMLVAGPPTPEGLSANGSGAKLIGSIGYVSQEEQRAPGQTGRLCSGATTSQAQRGFRWAVPESDGSNLRKGIFQTRSNDDHAMQRRP